MAGHCYFSSLTHLLETKDEFPNEDDEDEEEEEEDDEGHLF